MGSLPLARTRDIIIQTVGGEILIYDLLRHKALSLNETASIVYQACDGTTSFDELKRQNKFTDELIFLAIDRLKQENLLEDDGSLSSPFAGMRRREAIRKAGLTTMIALPAIFSIAAPTAVMAQSATSTCRARGETVNAPGATTVNQCRNRLENRCCTNRLTVFIASCSTINGVSSCSRCTGVCA